MTVETWDNDPEQSNLPDSDLNPTSADVTWRQAFKTLGIYFLVLIGISVLNTLLTIRLYDMTSVTNTQFVSQPVRFNLLAVMANALVTILMLLFQYSLLHLIAAKALDGQGTYRGLVHRATGPLIVETEVLGISLLGVFYVLGSQTAANPQQAFLIMTLLLSSPLFIGLFLFWIIVGTIFTFWFCVRVGQNYQFSWRKGCVTLLAWIGSMALIAFVFYIATIFISFQSLTNFRGTF